MIYIVKFQPVIKWSGSKRSQSEAIVSYMPKEIDTYYEPFVGGASVVYQLLHSDVKVSNYICSDINEDLINLWNVIKTSPQELSEVYNEMWNELNYDDDIDRRKEYFYNVRERFNKEKSPYDFLFLSRTCTNGLIRYNLSGSFNSSFHFSRKGINPKTLTKIIFEWSSKLNDKNVQFIHQDYSKISTSTGDFLYLDPPYAGTQGMYYGTLDYDDFWDWIRRQEGQFLLSFNGKSGRDDNTYEVPSDIYKEHYYIDSGVSSFKRIKEKGRQFVKESLYKG